MSKLTAELLTEKPTRALCQKGANRIDDLEDALVDLEAHILAPNRRLNITILHRVQRALYGNEAADRMARERGEKFDATV